MGLFREALIPKLQPSTPLTHTTAAVKRKDHIKTKCQMSVLVHWEERESPEALRTACATTQKTSCVQSNSRGELLDRAEQERHWIQELQKLHSLSHQLALSLFSYCFCFKKKFPSKLSTVPHACEPRYLGEEFTI
jgi:hypothetical protein